MSKYRSFLIVLSLLALGLAACSAAQAAPVAVDGEATAPPRTLSVTGTGRISLTPDIARITVGVQTEGKEAAEAVAQNNARAQEVIAALKAFGIPDEDIRTQTFSVYPRRDYSREGRPQQITYVVQNTLSVTVRDLDQIGEVLDAVVRSGANDISGIQFDIADRSGANAKALQAAVAEARGRADVLAQAAGVELGAVQTIATNIGGGVPVFAGRMALDVAEAAEVPVSPGQMEITADVTIVYELR